MKRSRAGVWYALHASTVTVAVTAAKHVVTSCSSSNCRPKEAAAPLLPALYSNASVATHSKPYPY